MRNVFRLIALALITVILLLLFSGCVLIISSENDVLQQGGNKQVIENVGDNNTTIIKQNFKTSTTDESHSDKTDDLFKSATGLIISLLTIVSCIIGTVIVRGKAQKIKTIIDLIIAILKIEDRKSVV